jgi:hypothetical protein
MAMIYNIRFYKIPAIQNPRSTAGKYSNDLGKEIRKSSARVRPLSERLDVRKIETSHQHPYKQEEMLHDGV